MDGIIPNINDSMAGLHQALQAATDRLEQEELELQDEIERRLPEILDNLFAATAAMSIEEMLTHDDLSIRKLGSFLKQKQSS